MRFSASALLAAVERFAHARGAIPAVFLWNFGQSSVVPGPAELLLVPLAIADPPRAWKLAAAAVTGSVLGACVAYWLGAAAFATIGRPMLEFLGVSHETLNNAMLMMATHGVLFVIGSTLTPLSTKAVSIGAGAVAMPFPAFLLAIVVGRTLRFSIDALLIRASAGVLHRLRLRLLKQ